MNKFIWCTYRLWSFQVLEKLLEQTDWNCEAIVTTPNCIAEFDSFKNRGIQIIRSDPKRVLDEIDLSNIQAGFFLGWSWIVPETVTNRFPCVTLHPGKLPKDRGGSPIQNQIRNGETWTYANLIQLEKKLDAGGVFGRERISLEGDRADEVWARMSESGTRLCTSFLKELVLGKARARSQEEGEPSFYPRVKPEDAELKPEQQSASEMYNIVRAHNETDPNTYVQKAYLVKKNKRRVIEVASLGEKSTEFVIGADGKKLYLTSTIEAEKE